MSIWNYALIVVLILFSAFFSGSEIAYSSANAMRLKHAADEKKTLSARLAYFLEERYDRALVTILIGNNLVNIAASSVATLIAINLMGDEYAWVATIIMTLIILMFGEITPKIIASTSPDGFATLVAVPLRGLMLAFAPVAFAASGVVKLVSRLWRSRLSDTPAVTEDDLEILIENAEDEGVIDEEKSELLQSALDFDDVLAYEVITPRVDMFALDIADPYDELIKEAVASGYSRMPVYEDSVDNIIGILHINHLLRAGLDDDVPDIRSLLMPVNFVHRAMPLPDVLEEMKKNKCHMVIVTDEYGGTMGLLTMEDVLEQLVGDIWDESDDIEAEFTKVAENSYEASGDMRVQDLFEELDIDDREFDHENATLGGWTMEMLNGYPKQGDSFEYQNLTVTVLKTQNLRVVKLGVEVRPIPEEDDDIRAGRRESGR